MIDPKNEADLAAQLAECFLSGRDVDGDPAPASSGHPAARSALLAMRLRVYLIGRLTFELSRLISASSSGTFSAFAFQGKVPSQHNAGKETL